MLPDARQKFSGNNVVTYGNATNHNNRPAASAMASISIHFSTRRAPIVIREVPVSGQPQRLGVELLRIADGRL